LISITLQHINMAGNYSGWQHPFSNNQMNTGSQQWHQTVFLNGQEGYLVPEPHLATSFSSYHYGYGVPVGHQIMANAYMMPQGSMYYPQQAGWSPAVQVGEPYTYTGQVIYGNVGPIQHQQFMPQPATTTDVFGNVGSSQQYVCPAGIALPPLAQNGQQQINNPPPQQQPITVVDLTRAEDSDGQDIICLGALVTAPPAPQKEPNGAQLTTPPVSPPKRAPKPKTKVIDLTGRKKEATNGISLPRDYTTDEMAFLIREEIHSGDHADSDIIRYEDGGVTVTKKIWELKSLEKSNFYRNSWAWVTKGDPARNKERDRRHLANMTPQERKVLAQDEKRKQREKKETEAAAKAAKEARQATKRKRSSTDDNGRPSQRSRVEQTSHPQQAAPTFAQKPTVVLEECPAVVVAVAPRVAKGPMDMPDWWSTEVQGEWTSDLAESWLEKQQWVTNLQLSEEEERKRAVKEMRIYLTAEAQAIEKPSWWAVDTWSEWTPELGKSWRLKLRSINACRRETGEGKYGAAFRKYRKELEAEAEATAKRQKEAVRKAQEEELEKMVAEMNAVCEKEELSTQDDLDDLFDE
jgi:hypothetical protein